MKRFEHFNAGTVHEAVQILQRYQGSALINAGGTSLLTILKDDILHRYPKAVINIKTIPGLRDITEIDGRLNIGALATLNDIISNGLIMERYPLLATAARISGPPQYRYMSTVGGNLCQPVRCWYYRASKWTGRSFFCLRKGGDSCYALYGDNRYHSVFGAPRGCYAVYPSDMGIALTALDAVAVTSKRKIVFSALFDAIKGTVLDYDEILLGVEVPAPLIGSRSAFLSYRPRKSINSAIISCAVSINTTDDLVDKAAVILGAVAPVPHRATSAEKYVYQKRINEEVAFKAGMESVKQAQPLSMNSYKVKIAESLVARALLACHSVDSNTGLAEMRCVL